jgi:hypothetical protein
MPYKSAAQRAYLHIHEPKVAARWDKENPSNAASTKLPQHVKQTRQPKGQGGGGRYAGSVASPIVRASRARPVGP